MNLLAYLLGAGGLVAGALLTGMFEEFRLSERVDAAVTAAVQTERAAQVKICDGQRAADVNTVNSVNDAILDAALLASRSLGRTPVDQAELQDLCNADLSCRDRVVRAHK